jgi:hypothetical protein
MAKGEVKNIWGIFVQNFPHLKAAKISTPDTDAEAAPVI